MDAIPVGSAEFSNVWYLSASFLAIGNEESQGWEFGSTLCALGAGQPMPRGHDRHDHYRPAESLSFRMAQWVSTWFSRICLPKGQAKWLAVFNTRSWDA